jgi:hypothetical protein
MRMTTRICRTPLLGVAFVGGLLGCSNSTQSSGNTAEGGASGEVTAVACSEELELRLGEFVAEGQPLSLLMAGDPLHLWNAPQGGHVVNPAAEVRGLVSSIVDIEARLLDPVSDQLVKDDVRSIVMKPIAGDDGWMSPDIRSRSQVAHIALCPDSAGQVFLDQEFVLEIEIRERDSECRGSGVARVPVVPSCLQEASAEREFCVCECERVSECSL